MSARKQLRSVAARLAMLGFFACVGHGLGRGAARFRHDEGTRYGHVGHDQELELKLAVLIVDLADLPNAVQALDVAFDHLGANDVAIVRARRLIETQDRPDFCGAAHDRHLQVDVGAIAATPDDARLLELGNVCEYFAKSVTTPRTTALEA